jgi:hypothetical protein
MKSLKANITLNIELSDSELMSKLNILCMEYSISLEDFITASINKLLYDIEFSRKLRNYKSV